MAHRSFAWLDEVRASSSEWQREEKRRIPSMRRVRMVAMLALSGLVGCGGSDEDNIKLVRVTGLITKNGKPMANANVSFVPLAGNKDTTPGVDQAGPEGNYMIKFKGRTGVAPGKYKVTVTPSFEIPATAKVPEKFKNDPVMIQTAQESQGAGKRGGADAKKELGTSEFDAEVPDGTSVTLDFDVKATSAGDKTKK
jgi:hypothetical protein